MASSSKKIVNKLYSSRPAAVKTETVGALINLRVVSRFYKKIEVFSTETSALQSRSAIAGAIR